MQLVSLAHGELLLREGQRLRSFYIVRKGALVTFRSERNLLIFKRGEVLGLETALEGGLSPFTVMANGRTEVIELEADKFDQAANQSPAEVRAMSRHFLRMTDQLLGRRRGA